MFDHFLLLFSPRLRLVALYIFSVFFIPVYSLIQLFRELYKAICSSFFYFLGTIQAVKEVSRQLHYEIKEAEKRKEMA